jgi:hypothetical protein
VPRVREFPKDTLRLRAEDGARRLRKRRYCIACHPAPNLDRGICHLRG